MIHALLRSTKRLTQGWVTKAQASDSEDGWTELPDVLRAELQRQIAGLPSPKAYQRVVREAIAPAVDAWQTNLDAPNHLVVLGDPVDAIAKILTDSLQDWLDAPGQIISPFSHLQRPADPLAIPQQLRQALMPYQTVDSDNQQEVDEALDADDLKTRRFLVIIPSLEQCFLRCIDGWDGIEYLRDTIIPSRACFWVIGCNTWAWQFLDVVCQTSAYFNRVQQLPPLDGEDIQDWLATVADSVLEHCASTENPVASDLSDLDDEGQRSYWEAIAKEACHHDAVAARLWLSSLRMPKDVLEGKEVPTLTLEQHALTDLGVCRSQRHISLPSLPSLSNLDRYLLYSLLIHGAMSRSHLSLSLGEPESQLQSHVQRLLREGVLESRRGLLSVQAIYYEALRSELSNNNFVVS